MGLADDPKGPRQRMINMMYLVFIAMLALNMSKEVLQAFGDVNNSLETNAKQTDKRNSELMAGLATKAEEQPGKYKPLKEQGEQIQQAADELTSYLDGVKADLVADVDRDEDGELMYKNMDRADQLDQKFIANDKLTDEAKEFVAKIDAFRKTALAAANEEGLKTEIRQKFNTDPIKIKDGGEQKWIRHEFEGFPLIASITKMTNMQANAKQTESEILSSLFSGQLKSDVSMTNYEAIVVPDKTAFFAGENFTGKIYLGRVDKNLSFENVTINGKDIETTEAGQVNLEFAAGNVGEQDITGELQFKEGDSLVGIDVKSSYSVIPKPNSAVISADKMNVVYRGVQNPLTISIPGVANISANAPGMRKVGSSKYMLNPTNIKAREVNIKVNGKLPNGEPVGDSKKFRIKDIPRPVGTVRGQDGNGGAVKMQRRGLKISTISAKIPDFDFKLNLAVSGFKLQVPGKPIIQVSGQKLNSRAQQAVDAAKRGAMIQIFDIQAKIAGNSSYHLPPVSPVFVQLSN